MTSSINTTAVPTEAPAASAAKPAPTSSRPVPMIRSGARLRSATLAGSSSSRIAPPLTASTRPYTPVPIPWSARNTGRVEYCCR
ncbi:hypothetical protein UK12_19090 [Saccharothrix sp. ST-888]|nr:hypothetical protein UK12_19090 [Saccharothrix sp. ST-888]